MSANHWLHNVVTLWYHGGGHSVGASMVSVLQHLAQRWRWGRSVLLFAFLFFIGSAHFVNLYPLHTLFHNKHTHTHLHTQAHTRTRTHKKKTWLQLTVYLLSLQPNTIYHTICTKLKRLQPHVQSERNNGSRPGRICTSKGLNKKTD